MEPIDWFIILAALAFGLTVGFGLGMMWIESRYRAGVLRPPYTAEP